MVEAKNYLGVSEPLAYVPPTLKDLKLTEDLIQVLKEHDAYESDDRIKQRHEVLTYLEQVTRNFVRDICERDRKLSDSQIRLAGGKVVTYGSFHLGVNSKDADIDTLCVIPNLISRDMFFNQMALFLSGNPDVTKLNVVKDSYVPVIKFIYNGISIDLVCARLNISSVPFDLDLNDKRLLETLDANSIRSLNGHRVSNEILSLVPNVETFRVSIRCIKLWASKKSISANVLGFLGGIGWALLVARVCQFYPLACPSVIISKFFHIFVNWKWPIPVMLKTIEDGPSHHAIKPWNPQANAQDRAHRMPVITPAYPSMCCTHNVTESTLKIISGEFRRAIPIVDRILDNGASWNTLFTEDTFFNSYRHYIQVTASSNDPNDVVQWAGRVEAKLRVLVSRLESHHGIRLVHPYPRSYSYKYGCDNQASYVLASHGQSAISTNSEGFLMGLVYTKIFYIGLYMPVENGTTYRVDITRPINEYIRLSKSWTNFKRESMGLVVELLHQSELPSDVSQKKLFNF